jgi:two-component system, sensor histidine kinase and response regulator
VDLREVLHEAESIIGPIAIGKGLDLKLHLPDEPVLLETDRGKALQIALNLAGNAVKFTESGGVALSLSTDAEYAIIRVDDTGQGISSEHLEKIFDPFWQADPSTTRSAGGTGLGLAITRRMVHLLGGQIHVASELGVGTSATVRLPSRKASADPGVV